MGHLKFWKRIWICAALFGGAASALFALPTGEASAAATRPLPLNAEGVADTLARFRQASLGSAFAFEFTLRHLPRRDEETRYEGFLFGASANGANVFRLQFRKASSPEAPLRQFLLQNGETPRVWRLDGQGGAQALTLEEMCAPLDEGLLYSPFDLLMPFIYWNDCLYEGVKRVRGRITDLYLFRPPDSWRKAHPEQSAVRVALDRHFCALVYVQVLNAQGGELATFRIVDLKKVQEQWIVKSVDFMDEQTRDKDRFVARAASLNAEFPEGFFTPEGLEKPAQPSRFEPYERLD